MNRAEKAQWIVDVNQSVTSSSVVLVAHYKGLNVAQMTDLRGRIRLIGAGFKVAKNKLAQLALASTPFEQISKLFVGPTAIAYSSDPVAVAKVLTEFSKLNERLILVGGAFGATVLNAQAIQDLSKLPSQDELRAKIISLISTPATNLVRLLQAPAGQVARVIAAYAEKAA
jgi:large subunit ribosomal protein L10